MTSIYPILLAGGSGARLWPLSRKSYPKQFTKLLDETTLFQSSALRLQSSDLVAFQKHIILTNQEYRFIVIEQLRDMGIEPGPVLIEPEVKNTAAAILSASIFAYSNDKNAVLLVTPTDHVIPDTKKFHNVVSNGLTHARQGKIVTFGIKPERAETAYGYLELSKNVVDDSGTSEVLNFIEKPNKKKAKQMLIGENFYWNAGIFLFRADKIIEAFKTFAPKTLALVSEAVTKAEPDLGFFRLGVEPWSNLENISIDYAVMEKAENLVAVPYDSGWSDLGGWDAVWLQGNLDKSGNQISNGAHAIDCSNSLLRSEDNQHQIVGLGLDNIIAVATSDAVLVANKDRAQDVRKVVELLKDEEIVQAEFFPKEHRPWGWFESLVKTKSFQVKKIIVNPEASLSLQSHQYRSEHWIIVEGTAKVTINEDVNFLSEGQSTYVPLGAKHRLENPEHFPLVLIEVQIGSYLGEDDIIRYEDSYRRSCAGRAN